MPTSRRSFLVGGLAASTAAGAAGLAAGRATASPAVDVPRPIAFRGRTQAGVVDPGPAHASWLGFDLASDATVDQVRGLFRTWTDDFERMMRGDTSITDAATEMGDPRSRLEFTVGLGPGFFDALDLPGKPSWLKQIPAMKIDELEKQWAPTDLVVQVRTDDPLTLTHATRIVVASGVGLAEIRWQQRGFRPALRPGDGSVMRNAFGQLDGTVNPEPASDVVLHGDSAPRWLRGGTSMVIRRIRMDVATWNGLDRETRENAIGRNLKDGAPLSGGGPHAQPDLHKTDELGFPVIDPTSHMRRAMPHDAREQILRAPYNYDLSTLEKEDVGLIFVSYQADPVTQFVPIQKRLAQADLLNLWTTPIGSAVYAIPGGVGEGEYLCQHLLDGR